MTKCAMCDEDLLPGDEVVTLPAPNGDVTACMPCVEREFRSWCEGQGKRAAHETPQ